MTWNKAKAWVQPLTPMIVLLWVTLRSLKFEEGYLHDYSSPRQAREGISTYLEFYNAERPHQALGYQTPAEVYYR